MGQVLRSLFESLLEYVLWAVQSEIRNFLDYKTTIRNFSKSVGHAFCFRPLPPRRVNLSRRALLI
jgi:hypothetical protein